MEREFPTGYIYPPMRSLSSAWLSLLRVCVLHRSANGLCHQCLAHTRLLSIDVVIVQVRTPKVKDMPVFLGHGTSDPLIPLALAQSTANLLKQKGFSQLDFRAYPGVQHSISTEELQDLRAFILQVLPEQAAKPPTE